MTQHPLGTLANNPNDPGTDSDAPSAEGSVPSASPTSIVDTILNLDELLSADVRRAEKTARFYTRPDLEADIEQLNARWDAVTDARGNPIVNPDATVDDAETPDAIKAALLAATKAYSASAVYVRVTQMPEDEWQAWRAKHKAELDKVDNMLGDVKAQVIDDLVVESKARLTDPQTGKQGEPFTAQQIKAFRKKFGHPAIWEIAVAAWQVNASSGVSIPKSLISSQGPLPS